MSFSLVPRLVYSSFGCTRVFFRGVPAFFCVLLYICVSVYVARVFVSGKIYVSVCLKSQLCRHVMKYISVAS